MTDPFIEEVYRIAQKIPKGRVLSYSRLAMLAGRPRAARIVGSAMSHCPEGSDIPCHRVVRADGSLCEGYEFDIAGLQRELLRSEGVPFRRDGRVDMRLCMWDGD